MLRKRSRTGSRKKDWMADQIPLSSPTGGYIEPISSYFSSSKLFTGSDRNPKFPKTCIENRRPWEKRDSRGVGLGIVDSLIDENHDKIFSKPESRMVFFGSQLKIQIPPLLSSAISPTPSPQSSLDFGRNTHNSLMGSFSNLESRMVLFGSQLKIQIPPPLPSTISSTPSPQSSMDFGSKTRNSLQGSFSSGLSPSPSKKALLGSTNSGPELPTSPQLFTGCLSASEMELSEDYTCVISHGPNPKTTHIFDNCIVESCGVGFSSPRKENCFFNDPPSYPSDNFLSFCYACKKNLGQGKDIYMYRGEKAFCSRECRYHEMLSEEGVERCTMDSSVANYKESLDSIRDCS